MSCPFDQNGLASPEVDVGRCQIADGFVISQVIVIGDEGLDLGFEVAGQVVILQLNRFGIPIYDRRMKHKLPAAVMVPHPDDIREKLEKRLGRLHARQRLGIETDHEAQVFGQGLNFFHIENLRFSHALIEGVLRLSGFYWQGRRNASKLRVKQNEVELRCLPRPFDGFKILHLSLPGGIAITLDSVLPRSFGSGAWKYGDMAGYTSVGAGSSVVPVRFNCPPEITLHCLRSGAQGRSSIRAVPDIERE